MSRWTEIRGYTLCLQDRGVSRYVRVALCSREGFFGRSFNVREARAETAAANDAGSSERTAGPVDLGIGRFLAWRWQSHAAADEQLVARLRTLMALGYTVIESEQVERGPWEWLGDLVDRQLTGEADPDADDAPAPGQHLLDVLTPLDLDPASILEGLAEVLGLPVSEFREPTAKSLAKIDTRKLGLLLPFLTQHGESELREVGVRWLEIPSTVYEVDAKTVAGWLRREGPMCTLLTERIPAEGLALLGPDRLYDLSRRARSAQTRLEASRWVERFTDLRTA